VSYPIERAVVLPSKVAAEVIKNISMISANKKVAFGGYIDTAMRTFLIDRRDASGITTLTNHDWIVYAGKRFDIKEIHELEQSTTWVVIAKVQEGLNPPEDVYSIGDELVTFTDAASAVVA
jgi:hypothetical protein